MTKKNIFKRFERKFTFELFLLSFWTLALLIILNNLLPDSVVNLEFQGSQILEKSLYPNEKVIFVLIDGLSYRYSNDSSYKPNDSIFNKLTIFREIKEKYPKETIHKLSIVQPPASTINSIKSFSTGSIPSISISEFLVQDFKKYETVFDNFLFNETRRKKAYFYGDIIWYTLINQIKDRFIEVDYTDYYDHSRFKDPIVTNQIIKRMKRNLTWDVIVSHIADLDSQCHEHDLQSPETLKAIKEQNELMKKIIKNLDDNTTLIVTSDHGLMKRGCHFGSRLNETKSFLFAFRKKGFLGNFIKEFGFDGDMTLVDISRLFGVYTGGRAPFNNLGKFRPGLLDFREGEKRAEIIERLVRIKIGDFRSKVKLLKKKNFYFDEKFFKGVENDFRKFESDLKGEMKINQGKNLIEKIEKFEKKIMNMFVKRHNIFNIRMVATLFIPLSMCQLITLFSTGAFLALTRKLSLKPLRMLTGLKQIIFLYAIFFIGTYLKFNKLVIFSFSAYCSILVFYLIKNMAFLWRKMKEEYFSKLDLLFLYHEKASYFLPFVGFILMMDFQQNVKYTLQEISIQTLIGYYLVLEFFIMPLFSKIFLKKNFGGLKKFQSFFKESLLLFFWSMMDKISIERNPWKVDGTYIQFVYDNYWLAGCIIPSFLLILYMKIFIQEKSKKKKFQGKNFSFIIFAISTSISGLVNAAHLEFQTHQIFSLIIKTTSIFQIILFFFELIFSLTKQEKKINFIHLRKKFFSQCLYSILPYLIINGDQRTPMIMLILVLFIKEKMKENPFNYNRYIKCVYLTFLGGRISGNLFNNLACRMCVKGVYEEESVKSYFEIFLKKNFCFTISLFLVSFFILKDFEDQEIVYSKVEGNLKEKKEWVEVMEEKRDRHLNTFYLLVVICLGGSFVGFFGNFIEDLNEFNSAHELAGLMFNWIGYFTVILAVRVFIFFGEEILVLLCFWNNG